MGRLSMTQIETTHSVSVHHVESINDKSTKSLVPIHSGSQTLWIGLSDPGPIIVEELQSQKSSSRRRFLLQRDGKDYLFELPRKPSKLYDKDGCYLVKWIQAPGLILHYSWAEAMLCGIAERSLYGRLRDTHSGLQGSDVLPTSIAGLRRIVQKQHPDKNGGVEGPLFRVAKDRLFQLRGK